MYDILIFIFVFSKALQVNNFQNFRSDKVVVERELFYVLFYA